LISLSGYPFAMVRTKWKAKTKSKIAEPEWTAIGDGNESAAHVKYCFSSLRGSWRDTIGSNYEVVVDHDDTVEIRTKRPGGRVIVTRGLVHWDSSGEWIVWGRSGARSQYWLSKLDCKSLLWERTGSASFSWQRTGWPSSKLDAAKDKDNQVEEEEEETEAEDDYEEQEEEEKEEEDEDDEEEQRQQQEKKHKHQPEEEDEVEVDRSKRDARRALAAERARLRESLRQQRRAMEQAAREDARNDDSSASSKVSSAATGPAKLDSQRAKKAARTPMPPKRAEEDLKKMLGVTARGSSSESADEEQALAAEACSPVLKPDENGSKDDQPHAAVTKSSAPSAVGMRQQSAAPESGAIKSPLPAKLHKGGTPTATAASPSAVGMGQQSAVPESGAIKSPPPAKLHKGGTPTAIAAPPSPVRLAQQKAAPGLVAVKAQPPVALHEGGAASVTTAAPSASGVGQQKLAPESGSTKAEPPDALREGGTAAVTTAAPSAAGVGQQKAAGALESGAPKSELPTTRCEGSTAAAKTAVPSASESGTTKSNAQATLREGGAAASSSSTAAPSRPAPPPLQPVAATPVPAQALSTESPSAGGRAYVGHLESMVQSFLGGCASSQGRSSLSHATTWPLNSSYPINNPLERYFPDAGSSQNDYLKSHLIDQAWASSVGSAWPQARFNHTLNPTTGWPMSSHQARSPLEHYFPEVSLPHADYLKSPAQPDEGWAASGGCAFPPQAGPTHMSNPMGCPLDPRHVLNQMEFYFSDLNLWRDDYLKSIMMPGEGWVPLYLLQSFPRMHTLGADLWALRQAALGSAQLELDGTGLYIRLRDVERRLNYAPRSGVQIPGQPLCQ